MVCVGGVQVHTESPPGPELIRPGTKAVHQPVAGACKTWGSPHGPRVMGERSGVRQQEAPGGPALRRISRVFWALERPTTGQKLVAGIDGLLGFGQDDLPGVPGETPGSASCWWSNQVVLTGRRKCAPPSERQGQAQWEAKGPLEEGRMERSSLHSAEQARAFPVNYKATPGAG